MSARPSHLSAASPLSAKRARPLKGAHPAARRQIDLRIALFCLALLACGGDKGGRAARGRRRAQDWQGLPQALGANIERLAPGAWRIRGPGLGALPPPRETLDFGNAGRTGCRLMMGVVGGHAITATFDGDASLRRRPMRRILDPLTLMGAQVLSEAGGERAVDRAQGRPRSGARLNIAPRSPRRRSRSAVLLAGLNAPGVTTVVIEDQASRDHTEKMLAHFGAEVGVAPEESRGAADHARRPTGIASCDRGRSCRSVVGGVPQRRRPDRSGGGRHRRGADDEPAQGPGFLRR